MSISVLEREIAAHVHQLAHPQQQQVLAFIHTLIQRPQGVAGQTLRVFAGSIDHTALQAMIQAVTTGCEQVDMHEW